MNAQKLRVLPCLILLLPLDILVAAGLLITAAIQAIRPPWRFGGQAADYTDYTDSPRNPCNPRLVPKRATIQILNWDGKDLLAECLPSVIEAVRAAGTAHEILVVDNGSTDGSVQFLRDRFPEVRILQLDRNYGFVGGNNRGVETVKTDIMVFLNNDMIVDRDFLRPLLEGFTDDSVFAVTSQIFFEDPSRRREETGNTQGKFEQGFFTIWHNDIEESEKRPVIPVLWAGGGSCAFDRIKYLELSGLDDLYHPFYVEDLDLSYRAWKRGWNCLLAPASRVVHKHRATSSRKYTHRFVDETIRRNLFLFTWKNISDRSMLLEHILNLPRIHGRGMMTAGCASEMRAYSRACIRFPFSAWRRLRQHKYRRSDRDVLARSRQ